MTSSSRRLYKKVLLFGDSITQVSFEEGGWGASAANLLQRDAVIATVFFGANDASLPDVSPDKYISVEEYATNLKEIVEHLKTGGLRPDQIILITPPAFSCEEWNKSCIAKDKPVNNRSNENTGRYSRACLQVAKDLETHSVDLWNIMQEDKDWKRYLCDGLHLSPDGSQLLWKHLEKHFTKVAESLDMVYPDWSAIDPNNPESSLN